MTIASNQRILRVEQKLEQIEMALQVLLRSQKIEDDPVIQKIQNDIQGLKMRMGKVREPA